MTTTARHGVLRGKDGGFSGRRILGVICILWGIALETVAQLEGLENWYAILPGGVLILSGLILWGYVTWGNVIEAVRVAKGGQ